MTALTERPRPVAGPTFRAVARLEIEGTKRRKTLALIAAHIDGGNSRPALEELAERLELDPGKVGALVARLEADGLLVVHRRRKRPRLRYEVVLPTAGDGR